MSTPSAGTRARFLATKTRFSHLVKDVPDAKRRDKLFFSTRWAMILKAGDSAATTAHALSALSELCEVYWRPVYVFLRKQGYGREDAQDLTQGFFAHFIKNRGYAHADRK